MKNFRNILASFCSMLVLVLTFAAFTQSASATCSVSGNVNNYYTGQPVIEATVTITNVNNSNDTQTFAVKRSHYGNYSFTGLSSNSTYAITAGAAENASSGWQRWYNENGGLGGDTYQFNCISNNTATVNWSDFKVRTVYGRLIDDDTLGGLNFRSINVYNRTLGQNAANLLTENGGYFSFTMHCNGQEYDFDGIEISGETILTDHWTATYTAIDCTDAENNVWLGFVSHD